MEDGLYIDMLSLSCTRHIKIWATSVTGLNHHYIFIDYVVGKLKSWRYANLIISFLQLRNVYQSKTIQYFASWKYRYI